MDVTGGTGRLEGRHALVTGGTTGVGFAITGTTLLIDGGMTAGYLQRDKSPLAEPGP